MEKSLPSDAHKRLIAHLVERRENLGLTQQQLAHQLGEYQSFVARLESGQRRLDVIEFIRLSRILKFDPAKLVTQLSRLL